MLKNFKEIQLKKLVKADWNYKDNNDQLTAKLKENIKRNGQIENIIVRLLPTGFYEVVNGNHRLTALQQLNIPSIVAYDLGSIGLAQAQRIAIETNETRFDTNQDQLALCIQEILNDEVLNTSIEDLSKTMPFDEKDLQTLLDNLNHANQEEDDVDPEEESSNLKTFKFMLTSPTHKKFRLCIDQLKEMLNTSHHKDKGDNAVINFLMENIVLPEDRAGGKISKASDDDQTPEDVSEEILEEED